MVRPARLRSNDDVRAVLRRGRRGAARTVVVHVRHRGDDAPGRATAVASRRVGNAVQRNRAKRLLREAAALQGVEAGYDVALVARQVTPNVGLSHVVEDLHQLYGSAPIGDPRDREVSGVG